MTVRLARSESGGHYRTADGYRVWRVDQTRSWAVVRPDGTTRSVPTLARARESIAGHRAVTDTVQFRRQTPGEYVATIGGEAWTLERRRAEPGHPAGWYLYGPWGEPSGARMGERLSDALAAAVATLPHS